MKKLTPAEGVELMIEFYKNFRVKGCEFEYDGDQLLFQCGRNEFGNEKSFQYDITRQLISEEEKGGIWQLSLTLKFEFTDQLAPIESGNEWCSSLNQIDEFSRFVTEYPVNKVVSSLNPFGVKFIFDNAE